MQLSPQQGTARLMCSLTKLKARNRYSSPFLLEEPRVSLKLCEVWFVNEIGEYYRPLVFLLASGDQLKYDNNKCIHSERFLCGDKWFYPWAIDIVWE